MRVFRHVSDSSDGDENSTDLSPHFQQNGQTFEKTALARGRSRRRRQRYYVRSSSSSRSRTTSKGSEGGSVCDRKPSSSREMEQEGNGSFQKSIENMGKRRSEDDVAANPNISTFQVADASTLSKTTSGFLPATRTSGGSSSKLFDHRKCLGESTKTTAALRLIGEEKANWGGSEKDDEMKDANEEKEEESIQWISQRRKERRRQIELRRRILLSSEDSDDDQVEMIQPSSSAAVNNNGDNSISRIDEIKTYNKISRSGRESTMSAGPSARNSTRTSAANSSERCYVSGNGSYDRYPSIGTSSSSTVESTNSLSINKNIVTYKESQSLPSLEMPQLLSTAAALKRNYTIEELLEISKNFHRKPKISKYSENDISSTISSISTSLSSFSSSLNSPQENTATSFSASSSSTSINCNVQFLVYRSSPKLNYEKTRNLSPDDFFPHSSQNERPPPPQWQNASEAAATAAATAAAATHRIRVARGIRRNQRRVGARLRRSSFSLISVGDVILSDSSDKSGGQSYHDDREEDSNFSRSRSSSSSRNNRRVKTPNVRENNSSNSNSSSNSSDSNNSNSSNSNSSSNSSDSNNSNSSNSNSSNSSDSNNSNSSNSNSSNSITSNSISCSKSNISTPSSSTSVLLSPLKTLHINSKSSAASDSHKYCFSSPHSNVSSTSPIQLFSVSPPLPSDCSSRASSSRTLSPSSSSSSSSSSSISSVVSFMKSRGVLASHWFNIFNASVFGNRLPSSLPMEWSSRLVKTAGQTFMTTHKDKTRSAKIALSTRILDTEHRLRKTLLHESCHVAQFLLEGNTSPPHGPAFWKWADKASRRFPSLRVETRHSYDIHCKFQWECCICSRSFGRHSYSLDITKFQCACGGKLKFKGAFRSDGSQIRVKTPSLYNQFVRTQFENMKTKQKRRFSALERKAMMAEISEKWKAQKGGMLKNSSSDLNPIREAKGEESVEVVEVEKIDTQDEEILVVTISEEEREEPTEIKDDDDDENEDTQLQIIGVYKP